LERRYGDLTSLRESAKQWEADEFTLDKKEEGAEYVKVGGRIIIPWIKTANIVLSLIMFVPLTFSYCFLSSLTLAICLVNIIDNNMILAQKRKDADQNQHKNNSGSSGEGEVAIAGIPSVVVDEGIPLVSSSQYCLIDL
jgi:hypothetical protein